MISDVGSVRVGHHETLSQCAPKLSQGAPSLSQGALKVSQDAPTFLRHIFATSSISQLQALAEVYYNILCIIQILILFRSTSSSGI